MDFHAHLDLYPDPEAMIDSVRKAGIYTLSVTTTPRAFLKTKHMAKSCPRIRTALGLHPEIAAERLDELHLFDRLVSETPYVGEIGLDGSQHHKASLAGQRKAFTHILNTCERVGGRVLSIHSRSSATEVLDHLSERASTSTPILHWFSGSLSEITAANSLDAWFSVGPAMLGSKLQRSKVVAMPRNRVLLESDGPFATHQGQPLSPLTTYHAVPELAKLWTMTEDDTLLQLRRNLGRIGAIAKAKFSENSKTQIATDS